MMQHVSEGTCVCWTQAAGKEEEEEEKEDGEITAEDRLQKKRDDHAAAQLELKVCCSPGNLCAA